MVNREQPTFAEYITPLSAALADERVAVVGGLPTHGLLAVGAAFRPEDRRVLVPRESLGDFPVLRPNGTVRDIDVIAFTDDPRRVQEVKDKINGAFNGETVAPEVSVSGYDSVNTRHNSWFDLVSKTIKDPATAQVVFTLGPVAVGMQVEGFEHTWGMSFGADDSAPAIPVLAPHMHVLRYVTRSVGGTRPRDIAKVSGMLKALEMADLPAKDVAVADPLMQFAQRLEDEFTLRHFNKTLDPRLLTMTLAKQLAKIYDGNAWFLNQIQSNSGLVGLVAKTYLEKTQNYTSTAI